MNLDLAIFLDSNFYLALIHPKDPHSDRSNEILLDLKTGKHGLLYTSTLVVSEVTTLAFIRAKGNKEVLSDLYELLWGKNKIASRIELSPGLEIQTWNMFNKVNDSLKGKKGFLSFVDVSILVLAKNKKIDYLVSFDEHFDGFINRIF